MQAADLQSPGAMAEDIGVLREGWDELGFGALYQDNEGISWQPAAQDVTAADLLAVLSFQADKCGIVTLADPIAALLIACHNLHAGHAQLT